MTYTEFAIVMAELAALFPRFELQKATIKAYHNVLSDLPFELFKAATMELAGDDSPWFPSAGQIRSTAFRLIEEERNDPNASDAWGEVMGAVRLYGYVRIPEFTDPIIAQCVKAIGGWGILCTSPINMLHTHRARFLQAFDTLQNRQRHRERMLPAVRNLVDRLAINDRPQLDSGIPELEDKGEIDQCAE